MKINDPAHYQRIFTIYTEARGIADHDSRESFLTEACGDDDSLRAEVLALLAQGNEVEVPAILDDAAIDDQRGRLHADIGTDASRETIVQPSTAPTHVGRFRVLRQIGAGGMGTVYEAEQDTPRRRVALKMVHAQRGNAAMAARLQREAEILGRLQHPGIAQVYDAGILDIGEGAQPYFAMELIDGLPLTKFADVRKLGDRERIELLATICSAVQYAHEKGIIHRDLKPDNVLVDDDGRAKVLDFGIASSTGQDSIDLQTMTREGQILGTLSYIAPEQLEHGAEAMTPSADIYALGVIGFELLSGRLPHDVSGMSIAQGLKYLSQHDPLRLDEISPRYKGDIATIIGSALMREPDQRYVSAAAMAADIRRHLDDQPILARTPTRIYRARKFVRRNTALVTGTTIATATLLLGTIVSTTFAFRAENARRDTADALHDLEQVSDFQASMLQSLTPDRFAEQMYKVMVEQYASSTNQSVDDVKHADAEFDEFLLRVDPRTVSTQVIATTLWSSSIHSINEQFADQPVLRTRLLQELLESYYSVIWGGLIIPDIDLVALHREIIAIRQEHLGDEHPDTLIARGQILIHDSYRQQKSDKEIDLLLEAQRRVLGPDNRNTLYTTALMGLYFRQNGDAARARVLADDGARRAIEHLDPTDFVYQMLLSNAVLDGSPANRHRYAGLASAGSIAGITSGSFHRLRYTFLPSIVLAREGRYEEAEQEFRRIDQQLLELVGMYPSRTNQLVTLAWILEERGDDEAAEQQLLDILEQAPSWQYHEHLLRHNLGFVQYKLGKFQAAEQNIRRSIETDIHSGILVQAQRQGNLSLVVAAQGRLEEAEPLARNALAMVNNDDVHSPHQVAHQRGALARVLWHEERYDEAEAELELAYPVLLDEHGARHERVTRVMGYFVDLYDAWHAEEPDAGYDALADEWRERLTSANDA